MMPTKRLFVPASTLLLLLASFGCSRKTDQAAQTASPADPNAAVQTANNAAPDANAPTQPATGVAPTLANSTVNPNQANANPNQVEVAQALTLPAGTPITVRLQQSLSSASARPGERFDAVIDQPVAVGDRVLLPAGTPVTGHVTVARRSGRLRHPGELGLALDTVTVGQQQLRLNTASVVARGGSHKKRNFAWIGGGAGGGALIGALAGGGKGALIGGPIGAAAGTTTAFITGKKDVGFGAERRLTFRLRYDVNLAG
jgi:hypothetical protein